MNLQNGNAKADYLTVYIRRDVLNEIAQTFTMVSQSELGEEPYRVVQPSMIQTSGSCGSCGQECEVLAIDTLTMPARIQCTGCSPFR